MPGYHERLRNLDNTRWLTRDFLIYGFRGRTHQKLSSPRTYDNERHRIEGLLGDTLQWRQVEGGRQYFISAESAALGANPLHKIYRLRTFTDHDLMLHCCLLSALNPSKGMALEEVTDAVCQAAEQMTEDQPVRRKLQEYTTLGLIHTEKQGKRYIYTLSSLNLDTLFPDDTGLEECLSFFREALPMGSLADGMMLRRGYENRFIRFKHHFLMHTLDDDILLSLLEIMHAKKVALLICDGNKPDTEPYPVNLLPVCVRVSEETGRRYLIGYDTERQCSRSLRLDLIRSVSSAEPPEDVAPMENTVRKALSHCWGISLQENRKLHHVEMEVRISLPRETFVLARLKREGRGGCVTRVDWDVFRYEIDVADTLEMMRWVRTFTGRIVSLKDSSGVLDRRFREDMAQMRKMYGLEATDDGTV